MLRHVSSAQPIESAFVRVDFVKTGQVVTKYGRSGRPKTRMLRVTEDQQLLEWTPSWKRGEARVLLSSVDRIQDGQVTSQFNRHKATCAVASDRSFSVIYDTNCSINVVCPTEDDMKIWVNTLRQLVENARTVVDNLDPDTKYLQSQWLIADADNSGTLSKDEVIRLVNKINIHQSHRAIRAMFAQVDVNHDEVLTFEEFKMLMYLLRSRPEVEMLWNYVVSGGVRALPDHTSSLGLATLQITHSYKDAAVPLTDFLEFWNAMQFQSLTLESARDLVAHVSRGNGTENRVTYNDFLTLLSGPDNSAFDPAKAIVYQDMTRPLSHYWIASSHNTYLEGDQLQSNSSVDRYIRDLSKGCRCVELDCWDGPDDEPIIYHGHTLTGRIQFKAVIEAVRDHSFVSSEYPVILSLENHCSIPQQQKMAAYLVTLLGNLLELPSHATGPLPSPYMLRNKVLIKGKRESFAHEEEEEGNDEDDESEYSVAPDTPASSTPSSTKHKKATSKVHKHHVAQELSDITYFGGGKFKSFEQSIASDASTDMYSFSENKTEKLIEKCAMEWVDYNKRQLSRIYPAGARVDSSNYDPVPSWCVGSQIVALNYQTSGQPLQLNDGKFRENGSCGYVLKPSFLTEMGYTFTPVDPQTFPATSPPVRIFLHIISGQQLPKPLGALRGEVIDPYVRISTHGVNADSTFTYRTKTIANNGFNPVWDEVTSCVFSLPELGLLKITVMDEDATIAQGLSDDFIAQTVIPVTSLRSGFRMVPLYSWDGTRHGDFSYAQLLFRIFVQPV